MKISISGIILALVFTLSACKTSHVAGIPKANIKEVVTGSDVTLVDVRIPSSMLQERQKMRSTFLWPIFRTILNR
jgi:hypothetical protein